MNVSANIRYVRSIISANDTTPKIALGIKILQSCMKVWFEKQTFKEYNFEMLEVRSIFLVPFKIPNLLKKTQVISPIIQKSRKSLFMKLYF